MSQRCLWVDDLRDPPEGWDVARTSAEALRMLSTTSYDVVSLDHDLGGDDTTRVLVLDWCGSGIWPREVRVHTANPVGREWLRGMIERYQP